MRHDDRIPEAQAGANSAQATERRGNPNMANKPGYDRFGLPDPFNPPPGQLPDGSPEPAIHPLVSFSVRNVVFSLGIFTVVVLLGLISATRLGTNLLPDFEVPILAVSTAYPGATPEQVNREVSERLEDAVSTTDGLTDIQTTSVSNQSALVLTFSPDTDIDAAANAVSQSVSAVRGTLPDGAEAPTVQKFDPNAQPILTLALLPGAGSTTEAATYADDILIPRLQRIPGVADVSISGEVDTEINVLLDPQRLSRYNLSAAQVSGAISSSALDMPAGTLEQGGLELAFSTKNTPETVQDVANIVVDPSRNLRVADVADVRKGQEDPSTLSRINGQPAVLLNVRKASGSNSVAVADEVLEVTSELAANLPAGYSLSVASDTTTQTRATVEDTFTEFLIAIAAVAIIVMLFLGRLNTVFAVILAVPISISAAPLMYDLFGFTFNIISLLAIIVAIGIVVDDSIVVAENVQRYRDLGYGSLKSVLLGGSEVFSAVTAASFSLLAVLVPLSLMPGILGQFFSQFSIGLIAAIVMSWLESLLFLTVRMAYTRETEAITWRSLPAVFGRFPSILRESFASVRTGRGWLALALAGAVTALAAWQIAQMQGLQIEPWGLALLALLAPLTLTFMRYLAAVLLGLLEALTATLHGATNAVIAGLAKAYARSVAWLLHRPWLAMVAALLFLVSAPLALKGVGFNFVPQSDSGLINVNVELPKGSDLSATNALTARLEDALLERPEIAIVQTDVGSGGISSTTSSAAEAVMTITLVDKAKRPSSKALVEEYRSLLQPYAAEVPGSEVQVSTVQLEPGGASDLSLGLSAPNRALLRERHAELLDLLSHDANIVSFESSLGQTRQERVFVPDPARLAGTGLTARDVAAALRTYNDGNVVGELREGDSSRDIVVRLNPTNITGEQALLSQTIFAPGLGANIPLSQLGDLKLAEAPATISRLNNAYTATIDIDLANGVNAFAYRSQLIQRAEEAGLLTDNVALSDASSFGSSSLTGDLVFYGPVLMVMAVLLVYLVLGSQFNSFRYPVYLLLPVPLALVGGLWSLRFFGADLDVITMLGMVILLGLSTKNSILYLEFVTERMHTLPLREALIEAAELRFRPIIMTTLTVLVISIPLVMGHGDGAEFRRGLGIVILGGIVTGTLLTFYVVPSVFYQFEKGRKEEPPFADEVEVPEVPYTPPTRDLPSAQV